MRSILLASIFLVVAACDHSHEHNGYETFQACFDEHTTVESLPVNQAIVVCCLDHPIHDVSQVCGATAADCVSYLGTNLSGPTQTEVSAACAEYETQKGM